MGLLADAAFESYESADGCCEELKLASEVANESYQTAITQASKVSRQKQIKS
jgi:hypothetical protein